MLSCTIFFTKFYYLFHIDLRCDFCCILYTKICFILVSLNLMVYLIELLLNFQLFSLFFLLFSLNWLFNNWLFLGALSWFTFCTFCCFCFRFFFLFALTFLFFCFDSSKFSFLFFSCLFFSCFLGLFFSLFFSSFVIFRLIYVTTGLVFSSGFSFSFSNYFYKPASFFLNWAISLIKNSSRFFMNLSIS